MYFNVCVILVDCLQISVTHTKVWMRNLGKNSNIDRQAFSMQPIYLNMQTRVLGGYIKSNICNNGMGFAIKLHIIFLLTIAFTSLTCFNKHKQAFHL